MTSEKFIVQADTLRRRLYDILDELPVLGCSAGPKTKREMDAAFDAVNVAITLLELALEDADGKEFTP